MLVLIVVLVGLFAIKHLWWPPAFRSLARNELRLGHIDEGLAWLEYVDWLVPDDAATTLLRARAYRKLGEMQQVRKLLTEAVHEGATDEEIRRERVLAWAQSGQMREAQPHLAGFLSDPHEDVDDVCEAFVIGYIRNQRFSDALSLLEAWTSDSPDLAMPFLLRGRLLAFRDEFDKAEADLRLALTLDPDLAEARLELALVLIEGNRFDEAIPWLEGCLDSPKVRSSAMVELATCLKVTGEGARALELLEHAKAEFPEDHVVLLELGRIQFENGAYESAVENLRNAVTLNPLNDEAHYVLAQSLSLSGRLDEARPHFEFVEQARAALAEIDRLNRVVLQDPTDIDSLVTLGQLYLQHVNVEEGVIRLHSALDLDPENQTAHRLLYEHYTTLAEGDAAFRELADEHRRHLR